MKGEFDQKEYAERLEVIYSQAKKGKTLQAIGDYVGLTRERVRQIVAAFRILGADFPKLPNSTQGRSIKKTIMLGIIEKYKTISPTEAEEKTKRDLATLEEVYRLSKEGVSRPEIAERLQIPYTTVCRYCKQFQDLGVEFAVGKNVRELIGEILQKETV